MMKEQCTTRMKSFDDLVFTDDYMFCKVLTQNPDLCMELVEVILGRRIEKIVGIEDQKSIRVLSDGKGVRLDVFFADQEGVLYDLEMQNVVRRNIPKRSRYYQALIDQDVLGRGVDYEELRSSYVIFIMPEDAFEKGKCIYTFENQCVDNPSVKLNDGAYKVFLCADGDMEGISPGLGAFIRYLSGKGSEDDFTRRLDQAVDDVRTHDEWRSEYDHMYVRDMDIRAEGRNEGREQAYYEMVRDGDISEEKAASKLSLAIDAFKEAYALWLKSQTSMV